MMVAIFYNKLPVNIIFWLSMFLPNFLVIFYSMVTQILVVIFDAKNLDFNNELPALEEPDQIECKDDRE